MVLYGITGGLGMGKSTVAGILADFGIAVVDTDELARQLTASGGLAIPAIRNTFSAGVLSSDGSLNRAEMARLVFDDPAALRQLESILHPMVRAAWMASVTKWRLAGQTEAAVVIPLLFETSCESEFDRLICVACTFETQKKRAAGRGWPEGQLEKRQKAQLPTSRKMELAEFVLWNEGDSTALKGQMRRIFALN